MRNRAGQQAGFDFSEPVTFHQSTSELKEVVLAQIARDRHTLANWTPSDAPSRRFYEERIRSFTEWYSELID